MWLRIESIITIASARWPLTLTFPRLPVSVAFVCSLSFYIIERGTESFIELTLTSSSSLVHHSQKAAQRVSLLFEDEDDEYNGSLFGIKSAAPPAPVSVLTYFQIPFMTNVFICTWDRDDI